MCPSAEAPAAVRLLVLQPTPFCNIACDYCYLAERDARRRMPLEVVEAAVENVRASGMLGPSLGVVWHAGEPLAVPRAFYEAAFAAVEKRIPPSVALSHSIQTNGTLVDDRWAALFAGRGVRVGVSLDGPARVHDAHRRTRDGKPTHERVMRGIDALRRHGVAFHAIAVVTEASLDHADAIADFFIAQGIAEVGFNVDEQEGANLRSSLDAAEDRYRAFMRRIFARSAADPERFRVRELERALEAIACGMPGTASGGKWLPDNPQVLPFAITAVDAAGNFSCFSPELLDQSHPRYGPFAFGNVLRDRMSDVLASARFRRLFADIRSGVRACAASCGHFSLCGGGAPVNKLNEHGTFQRTETAYCRRTVQTPLELALELLEAAAAPGEICARFGARPNSGALVAA